MHTDAKRLQQVLKNLLSNAFKFTEDGRGHPAHRSRPTAGWSPDNHDPATRARAVVAFAVTDTGIGIRRDKQQIIFEAFQQADGGTSRKYGGTGLGLAISREIARLLGGEIQLAERARRGQHLHPLPAPDAHRGRAAASGPTAPAPPRPAALQPAPAAAAPRGAPAAPAAVGPVEAPVARRRGRSRTTATASQPGDRVLLIVEDDPAFARFLLRPGATRRASRPWSPSRGADGPGPGPGAQARRHHPRHQPARRRRLAGAGAPQGRPGHPPHPGLHHLGGGRAGARAAAGGPGLPAQARGQGGAEPGLRRHPRVRGPAGEERCWWWRTTRSSARASWSWSATATCRPPRWPPAQEALAALERRALRLHGAGPAAARHARAWSCWSRSRSSPQLRSLPIIVYTAKDLSAKEETQLKQLAQTIILKDVRSPERLLDETALFLHRNAAEPARGQARRSWRSCTSSDALLAGKKVLLVDDDIRNIFALTSVLERHKMEVLSAENGQDALEAAARRRPASTSC